MKKIAIVLVMVNTLSCSSQSNEKINITGNWFNYENTTAKDVYYVESFVNKDSIYYYNDFVGLTPNHSYIIEDSVLYYKNKKQKIESGTIKIIDENTISLNRKDGFIVLKRVVGGDIKLEDFLFGGKSEDEYWEAFDKRKSVWEKSKE